MKRGFIIVGCLLFLVYFGFNITYGLFESNLNYDGSINVAKFNLFVNDTNIVDTNSFVIESITTNENENVLEGKVAPGVSGYFTVVLSAAGSEVALLYNISVDLDSAANAGLSLTNVEDDNGSLIKTGVNTYTGLFTLDDLNASKTIKIYFTWENNDENNLEDSKFIIGDVCNIPVTIEAVQYLGEDIVEYQEGV